MVKIVNLNKKTDYRDEAFNKDPNREKVFGGFTGPNPTFSNRFDPNENQFFRAYKSNPEQEGFYTGRMFLNEDADQRRENINLLSQTTNNEFSPGNKEFADIFVRKYATEFKREGDAPTAEEVGLLGPVDPNTGRSPQAVVPSNLRQFFQTDAASANATIDPNTAGKFPSNEVNV